jgi:hypothetical protein
MKSRNKKQKLFQFIVGKNRNSYETADKVQIQSIKKL